jgi:3-hydroxy acid dehydrogenase/malonic semialdehyde reductase
MLTMTKTVLITGATAGIGFATTQAFLKKGYKVWAVGRRTEKLETLKKQYGSQLIVGKMDVTLDKSVEGFFAKNSPQNIDILINNAGLALGTDLAQDAKLIDFQKMIDTNIMGLLRVTHAVLPYMAKKPGSHIVNIGSVAGVWSYPGGNTYSGTKAFVKLFSQGLRLDLLGKKVKVTNVQPGMVETEFSVVRTGSKKLADKIYQGMDPLTSEDIAESILWCVERPNRVNVSEITIFPTDQAGVGPHYVSRAAEKKEGKKKS